MSKTTTQKSLPPVGTRRYGAIHRPDVFGRVLSPCMELLLRLRSDQNGWYACERNASEVILLAGPFSSESLALAAVAS